MSRVLSSFLLGGVFGLGLAISQMTDPNKVLAFLDFFGDWDPSLLLVMGAAVGVNLIAFRLILRRERPAFDERFHMPTPRGIDARLVGGSVLFGAGWGLSGLCPGGAVAALGSGTPEVIIFVIAMAAGLLLQRVVDAVAASTTEGSNGSLETT
jgi:uncharacterized membrane protein YedE/YeeE